VLRPLGGPAGGGGGGGSAILPCRSLVKIVDQALLLRLPGAKMRGNGSLAALIGMLCAALADGQVKSAA
jgi:hypothetical protein